MVGASITVWINGSPTNDIRLLKITNCREREFSFRGYFYARKKAYQVE